MLAKQLDRGTANEIAFRLAYCAKLRSFQLCAASGKNDIYDATRMQSDFVTAR